MTGVTVFCRNCGNQYDPTLQSCPACGFFPPRSKDGLWRRYGSRLAVLLLIAAFIAVAGVIWNARQYGYLDDDEFGRVSVDYALKPVSPFPPDDSLQGYEERLRRQREVLDTVERTRQPPVWAGYFFVDDYVKVKVLGRGYRSENGGERPMTQILLLEGDHKGKTGWVESRLVHYRPSILRLIAPGLALSSCKH